MSYKSLRDVLSTSSYRLSLGQKHLFWKEITKDVSIPIEAKDLVGRYAVNVSELKRTGYVWFANRPWDAMCESAFPILDPSWCKITDIQFNQLIVKQIEPFILEEIERELPASYLQETSGEQEKNPANLS